VSRTRRYRGPKRQAKVPKAAKNRRKLERRALRKLLRDGCSGKRRITERSEAIEIATEILERNPSQRAVGVYLCDKCGHLHVTSRANDGCCLVIERTKGESA
jgi:rubrerythrin